jgi:threonine/homoserine/homoserine lactone efflux protein
MIVKGFRFGLLLQLAVGPVCVFVLNQASNSGFAKGMAAVAAITLVDAAYIFLAIAGISRFVDFERYRKPFAIIGAAVILYFSIDIFLGAVAHISLLPKVPILSDRESSFLGALVLTASNPLTILFWSGVFSAKIVEERMSKGAVCWFGLGAVLSTVLFLTLIAGTGVLLHDFLPAAVMKILNIAVALFLIYFAVIRIAGALRRS